MFYKPIVTTWVLNIRFKNLIIQLILKFVLKIYLKTYFKIYSLSQFSKLEFSTSDLKIDSENLFKKEVVQLIKSNSKTDYFLVCYYMIYKYKERIIFK